MQLERKEINRKLKLGKEARKLEKEREKQKLYQEAIKEYPFLRSLSIAQAIKYKNAVDTYPDLKELDNIKLILLAYDFRQEQIRSYQTNHTTELANARCNARLGGYKAHIPTPKGLPALSFEKECIVCHLDKEGINLCPECWQQIRRCLDLKGKSHREGWEGWGVEMDLDLSDLVKLLKTPKNELKIKQ